MTTAVENEYIFAKLDELEPAARLAPGATDDGRRRFDVRRTLDITAFGVSAFSAPSGVTVINEHDETLLGEAGQEELYIVLNGGATFEIDGETSRLRRARWSTCSRRRSGRRRRPKTSTTILVVGGTPGKAYEPDPEEAARGIRGLQRRRLRDALAKQLVVVEKRPGDPVAHFNVGCFAARAGPRRPGDRAPGRAVEINDRIKELIATDEDLDSIREDQRFVELAK